VAFTAAAGADNLISPFVSLIAEGSKVVATCARTERGKTREVINNDSPTTEAVVTPRSTWSAIVDIQVVSLIFQNIINAPYFTSWP
jgi:hypothetical protein